jgi:hypothetical protein
VHIIIRFANAFETGIDIDIWYSISNLQFSYAIVGLLHIGFLTVYIAEHFVLFTFV